MIFMHGVNIGTTVNVSDTRQLTGDASRTYNSGMNPRKNHLWAKSVPFILALVYLLSTQTEAQTASSDGLRLIGTINGGKLVGAVFQDSAGKQTFFQIQEKLPDGSRIIKVREDSIVLKGEDGNLYEMYFARDTKTASTGQNASVAAPIVPESGAEGAKQTGKPPRRRARHSTSAEEE